MCWSLLSHNLPTSRMVNVCNVSKDNETWAEREEIWTCLAPSQVSPAEGYQTRFAGATPVCSPLPTLGTSRRDVLAALPFPLFYLMKRWFGCAGSGNKHLQHNWGLQPPTELLLWRGERLYSWKQTKFCLSSRKCTSMAWSRSELTLQHFIQMSFAVLFF